MAKEIQTITAEPVTCMPGDTLRLEVDFTLFGLDPTELLTGTPVVTDPTGLLTISNQQVNTTTFLNRRKKTVAIGKGAIFSCAVPTNTPDGTDFILKIGCGTNGSPAQFLQGRIPIWVRTED